MVRRTVNNDGFLRQAATLTAIVLGVLTLVLTVILPLYGTPPFTTNVDRAAEAQAPETREALCTIHRVIERIASTSVHQNVREALLDEAHQIDGTCPEWFHWYHGGPAPDPSGRPR